MKKLILVTGAEGFIGKNLCTALRRNGAFEVIEHARRHGVESLMEAAKVADVVFHLAGVNRPIEQTEFHIGNVQLTHRLCERLVSAGRQAVLVFSSSVQAQLDNPYGLSKKEAEDTIFQYHATTGAAVYVYRFTNVFGKWSRPAYNTVIATFCHNISRGLPVQLGNRDAALKFTYIDDIIRTFIDIAGRSNHDTDTTRYEFEPTYPTTLGELHDLIVSFQEGRKRSLIPNLSDPLTKYLYSTFASFIDPTALAFPADVKSDDRGWLFELLKTVGGGQVFVSLTRPGVTRGNHYHDTKLEKFCVVSGEGVIRLRHALGDDVIEYRVNGRSIQLVDIPPGYTHSIANVGTDEMITLFWANEIFDPLRPDTYFTKVIPDPLPKSDADG